jgi:hypothetical protein
MPQKERWVADCIAFLDHATSIHEAPKGFQNNDAPSIPPTLHAPAIPQWSLLGMAKWWAQREPSWGEFLRREGARAEHPATPPGWLKRLVEWSGPAIATSSTAPEESKEIGNWLGLWSGLRRWAQLARWEQLEGQMLHLVAARRDIQAISWLARELKESPCQSSRVAAIGLQPLMAAVPWPASTFFDLLRSSLFEPAQTVALIEVANQQVRLNLSTRHPLAPHRETLRQLLGQVVGRLGVLEQNPGHYSQSIEEIQTMLEESVALVVALCDLFGLMQDEEAVGKLRQAMMLRHRRIQVEAASALSRLGQAEGTSHLVSMAKEPSERMRVIAYATRDGGLDAIDPVYRTPEAQAESLMALWLAERPNLGMPPEHLEVIYSDRLFWPGYQEPQPCFLVYFRHAIPSGLIQNIGIVGPVVHCLPTSLIGLDAVDQLAAYAGWHVSHPEIWDRPWSETSSDMQTEFQPLLDHLEKLQPDRITPQWVGSLLGTLSLSGRWADGDRQGIVATDGEVLWSIPLQPLPEDRTQPIDPQTAIWILHGRTLLRQFNPDLLVDSSSHATPIAYP